jgi:hypothetical protein
MPRRCGGIVIGTLERRVRFVPSGVARGGCLGRSRRRHRFAPAPSSVRRRSARFDDRVCCALRSRALLACLAPQPLRQGRSHGRHRWTDVPCGLGGSCGEQFRQELRADLRHHCGSAGRDDVVDDGNCRRIRLAPRGSSQTGNIDVGFSVPLICVGVHLRLRRFDR